MRAAATDPAIPAGTTVPAEYTPDAGLAFIRRQWGRLLGTDEQDDAVALSRIRTVDGP